jgi:DNA-binding CsgD family transcriptional regulator
VPGSVRVLSDHPLFRRLLSDALRRRGTRDITILDLDHAAGDVLDAVVRTRKKYPGTRLVVVGSRLRLAAAAAAVEVGVASDGATPRRLLAARPHRPRGWILTDRQREVLRWLVAGLDNAAIGRRLAIGERAVKAHISALLVRLRAANRTELAVLAYAAGVRAPSRRRA